MKISIQTGDIVDRLGLKAGYAAIKKAGFEAVDWNIDHAWKGSDLRNGKYRGTCIFEKPIEDVIAYYAKELEIIRKNNLKITQAHAPFPCYVKEYPDTLDFAIECYKKAIEYCQYAKIKNLVIHGYSWNINDTINSADDVRAINFKLYSSLIPTLLKNDYVTVCLENLFFGYNGVNYEGHCSDAKSGADLIDELNALAGKEVFGLCFDTGHANLLRHDMRVFIPVYGKRIKALHIHDNNGSNDNHMAPFAGTINWQCFCSALHEIGYDGDLSFETFAQTNIIMNYDNELLKPWLNVICKTGESFRKKIIYDQQTE